LARTKGENENAGTKSLKGCGTSRQVTRLPKYQGCKDLKLDVLETRAVLNKHPPLFSFNLSSF
jgi:hypothetical protein